MQLRIPEIETVQGRSSKAGSVPHLVSYNSYKWSVRNSKSLQLYIPTFLVLLVVFSRQLIGFFYEYWLRLINEIEP